MFFIHYLISSFLVTKCSSDWPGLCAILITVISLLLVLVTFPFSLIITVKVHVWYLYWFEDVFDHRVKTKCIIEFPKVVKEYERAVIFRLGRLLSGGARGPGIFFVLPCVDSYSKVRLTVMVLVTSTHPTFPHQVDMRTVTFDVPPQEILTRDSVTIHVDAIMYYKVCIICLSQIKSIDDCPGQWRHFLYRQCWRLWPVHSSPRGNYSQVTLTCINVTPDSLIP